MTEKNETIVKLAQQINNLSRNIGEMESQYIIKVYNDAKKQKEQLIDEYEKTIKKIQDECKHTIWYFISQWSDGFENKSYMKCRCLDCYYITEEYHWYFKNAKIIHTKENFETVQAKYKEIKSSTEDTEVIYLALKEFFKC